MRFFFYNADNELRHKQSAGNEKAPKLKYIGPIYIKLNARDYSPT